ncbi:MAG: TrkA family potassium uptake protein [Salinimicrobium sediminis]|uniref:Trk system potassium uptake protein TrkA n=1 Tax=Salinimicrobium sediminis TaxID=1343891 RepID=A0A285X163_9FLAO|nr:TrkA family potassium uptake protein [Salinimicrobium sediminis]MDX1602229.1 TrkA family potassium uptake protein [Salinimicrobium sediminis]MDX1752412.1 TrkA family potassium uptake protein [Salinimicrobium sediminis]SOC78736.1 trk system potassium uptake protein TrkA [Salinimicrobium sediminis]
MKYIIIGLGNFGASLAEKLTKMGNEVIGVDVNMSKVEAIKDKITHAVNLDSTDITAVSSLPLKDTDIVIVGIGEDKGANIMATALMKQLHVKRLISRAVSPLQEMVLEAMGVDEIIHPEEETAERWSKKLNLQGVVDSFEVNRDYSIIETEVPDAFDGKTLEEIGLKRKYDIIVLTTIKITREKNELGTNKDVSNVQGVASAKTVMYKNDIMVLYGHNKNLKKLLKDQDKY